MHKGILLLALGFSIPSALALGRRNGPKTAREAKAASQLIVTLKKGATHDSLLKPVNPLKTWSILPGFLVNKDDVDIEELRADPNVIKIQENKIGRPASQTQNDAPWGLGRLHVRTADDLGSTDATALNYRFQYDDAAGDGVDIYIIDTGVRISHQEFGGRARHGQSFGGLPNDDRDGHGTHVAAIAAGAQFGVAKRAQIISVRVFDDQNDAETADVVSAIEYVADQAALSGRPTVVNMSFSYDDDDAIDDAVIEIVAKGLHAVVSAGNDDYNTMFTSPARVDEAITVGASNITDHRWSNGVDTGSNYGNEVDIYAPGQDIISASHISDTASISETGTSMAAPHVAGLVAYLLTKKGDMSPANMKKLLLDSYAVKQLKADSLPYETTRLIAQIDECGYWCYFWYW